MDYPYNMQQGRFILVTANHVDGSHTLHNWPSITHAECIHICQARLGVVKEHTNRLILRVHHDEVSDVNTAGEVVQINESLDSVLPKVLPQILD